jgi:hypothetical protein
MRLNRRAIVLHGECAVAMDGCGNLYRGYRNGAGIKLGAVFKVVSAVAATRRTFVQILAKLCFLKLLENFRRILFEYGPNDPIPANRPFNPPC